MTPASGLVADRTGPVRLLSGWGRTAPSAAEVCRPSSAEELVELMVGVERRGQRVVARGLGRSYGDAAQCAGGTVIDTTALSDVLDWDADTGTLRVGAGASLDAVMRTFVPQGFFVPVSPGTRHVTVGGAVAADIHGKNHHRDGSFCSHVTRLALASPTGLHELSPAGAGSEPFWATAGGMGMTGVVVDVTVSLLAVETAWMRVDTERARDLDHLMASMTESDADYRYSVAWIDCLAGGGRLGRGVLSRGDHARHVELPRSWQETPLRFVPRPRLAMPVGAPSWLLDPLTVAAFNETWYRKAPKHRSGELKTVSSFFHPLDGVRSWNRLYGRRGFLQYQFAVPLAASDVVRAVLERLAQARAASFLAVLKRFGGGDPGPLSFPIEGWTLALDLPLAPGLGVLLDQLDEVVAAAGGRVYLAKDSRLRPELLGVMYSELDTWRAQCEKLDPQGVMASDLSRRLNLTGSTGRPW